MAKKKRKELTKAKKSHRRTIHIGSGRKKTGRSDKYSTGSTRDAYGKYKKDHPTKPRVKRTKRRLKRLRVGRNK